ncbi:type 4a pilus biogenesis protein PilO [Halomonas sp. I1]|uniref:type 4a pilus biogenesis protein PilO n=1 Tax=Halomonas sp. I1 TaxID=393536 RepID=UPI0028DDB2EB|nr:type 4a pilus biogenesis protein PilO [Halomonas sp. I1]MDT8894439.1 type 4a pilus biogenesis protein PilO [Halomonas sp. I1]
MRWQSVRHRLMQLDWRELDVRDADRWPLGLQWLCCGVLVVVLSAVTYMYLALPTARALEDAKLEEAALLERYRDDVERAARLPGVRERVMVLERHLAGLATAFPERADMASLIDDIGSAALEHQLSIEAIRLEVVDPARFVIVHPVSVRVTGPYHRLGGFIADVADLPRLVTLHDVRLVKAEGRLQLSVQARAYSARPPSAGERGE